MENYKRVKIYYFTGTGNALNVARWFQHVAIERSIECVVTNITEIESLEAENNDTETLVVIISPVHGFNYPPIMIHFISHFPRGKRPIVLMNTRAGMLIGKWVTPGLSGISFYFAATILKLKGYSIAGLCAVDMPSNWFSAHPGLNDRTILFIHNKMKLRVMDFAQKILDRKKSYVPVREIIQDVAISPIALLYFFMGRFVLAKTFFASNQCDACGLCVNKCPVKAITMINQKPFWKLNCESCMKCMSNCPKKAIETAHGLIVFTAVLFHLGVLGILNYFFSEEITHINPFLYNWIIQSLLFIALLVVCYRLMHFLKRYRWFEKLLVYTSLTHYKFWGKRYRALKNF